MKTQRCFPSVSQFASAPRCLFVVATLVTVISSLTVAPVMAANRQQLEAQKKQVETQIAVHTKQVRQHSQSISQLQKKGDPVSLAERSRRVRQRAALYSAWARQVCQRAELTYKLGDPKAAWDVYQEATKLIQKAIADHGGNLSEPLVNDLFLLAQLQMWTNYDGSYMQAGETLEDARAIVDLKPTLIKKELRSAVYGQLGYHWLWRSGKKYGGDVNHPISPADAIHRAADFFRTAVQHNKTWQTLKDYGHALTLHGNLAKAESILLESVRLSAADNSPDPWMHLALLYLKQSEVAKDDGLKMIRLQDALQRFSEAASRSNGSTAAFRTKLALTHRRLGDLQRKNGLLSAAVGSYQNSLKVAADNKVKDALSATFVDWAKLEWPGNQARGLELFEAAEKAAASDQQKQAVQAERKKLIP